MKKNATPAPSGPVFDERDWVNPYLSPLRQWVCAQLANLIPNNHIVISSNNPQTKLMFEKWTGYTQAGLEKKWEQEGFVKDPKSGSWKRSGGGPVTTSCEAFVNKLKQKIRESGFVPNAITKRQLMSTSFNLGGLGPNGMEPSTAAGWHWFREMTDDLRPQPGDMFQVATPNSLRQGQWSFAHVGVITSFGEGPNPKWCTVEAGQGGPAAGNDSIKRKGPRLLHPMDPKSPRKQLMGWLDIEEHFAN